MRVCTNCEIQFRPHRHSTGRFCSCKCWYEYRRKTERIGQCELCHRRYKTHSNGKNKERSKYCSVRCFHLARRSTLTCPACQQEFVVQQSSGNRYCSRKCAAIATRKPTLQTTCPGCSKSFSYRSMGGRKKKFCSVECMRSYYVGSRHPLYRGNRRHDRGPTWRKQSALARERDNNTCQGCGGSSSERASVDHIVPFRLALIYGHTDGIDPNHLDNLVCLCRGCHGKKTQAEVRLLQGDIVGFRNAVRAIIPHEALEKSLSMWGLTSLAPKQNELPIGALIPEFTHSDRLPKTVCKYGHAKTLRHGKYICLPCHKNAEQRRRDHLKERIYHAYGPSMTKPCPPKPLSSKEGRA